MTFKWCVVLCGLLMAVVAAEKYTSKYDNIDIQEIMDNERLLIAYTNCILDKGKCSPEGKELKDHIQDALETGCEKCTDVQKDKGKMLINFVIENKRGIWKEMTDKYDPKGIWRQKYEDEARAQGVIIPKDK